MSGVRKIKMYDDIYESQISVQELLDKWGPNALVSVDYDSRLTVEWERDETPQEAEARKRQNERARLAAAARKAKADEKDRELYEQLKKRFEK